MSATLGRLRRHFDDELLVRSGSGYTLTPLGRRLLPLVASTVRGAELTFGARSTFDPGTSDRRFVLASSGYIVGVLGPPLRRHLAASAPDVSIEFHAMSKQASAERAILEVDLMIGPTGLGLPGEHQDLFADDYVCLIDAGHPAAEARTATVELLSQLPHARVSFSSTLFTGSDQLLARLGVEPRVLMFVDDWTTVGWLLQGTDLIALLPRLAAQRWAQSGGFAMLELAGTDRARFVEAAYWHPSRASDPGLRWLCDVLRDVARRVTRP